MGPELVALVALLDGIREYGPWGVVIGLLLGIRTGELVLRREIDALAVVAKVTAEKAAEREAKMEDEIQFWRDRYLEEKDQSRTAIGAVGALSTTRGHR